MAKGHSSIQQKALRARMASYTPQQLMNYERCECDSAGRPPRQEVLDRIADEKEAAGYKIYRRAMCSKHNIALFKTGKCIECEAEEM